MVRLRWLALAALTVLPQCAGDGSWEATPLEMAVLDVVVDSLPYTILQTWGMEGDRPFTALLNSAAPEGRALDPGQGAQPTTGATPRHSDEWLARQTAKDHIVGTCSPVPDEAYCDFNLATVVATISTVRFTTDGAATVEVAIGRRDFGSIVELALAPTQTSWEMVDFSIIVIS